MTQLNKGGRTMGAQSDARDRRKVTQAGTANGDLPGWTNGLRQLYDQVVDEDLPDSFRDLLARLDDHS